MILVLRIISLTSKMDVDADPQHADENPTGQTYVELVRIFERTKHVSTIDRQKETEFTIRNNSDEDVNYVFLPLREFKVNLKILDEEGRRLNYFPNSEVEEFVDQVKDENKDAHKRMQHRFKHVDYKLYIQLPPNNPLEPGEMQTITLTYEQSEPVTFYSLWDPSIWRGWKSQWEKKFFKIPSFLADAKRYPGHPHDEFLTAVGTPGYVTRGTITREGGEAKKEFYENGLDDDTRVFSARLPPADRRPYEWTLQYDLIPSNRNLMKVLAFYWVAIVCTGLVSIVFPLLDKGTHLANYGMILSGSVITATIGLIFALNTDWTERFRILCVIPLLLHGMAWILWSFTVPSAP